MYPAYTHGSDDNNLERS